MVAVLDDGKDTISNVTIKLNEIINTPNTAIRASVVDELNILDNVITSTKGSSVASLGDGVKLTNVTESSAVDGRASGSGVDISLGGTVNLGGVQITL